MDQARWQTDGKFFRAGKKRVWIKAVTYGPFPGGWPAMFEADFSQMVAAGFNALRLYEMADMRLLDAAEAHGLKVFSGLKWGQNIDFFARPRMFSAARISLQNELRMTANHPALAGVYVGNEIPTDLVRWMGPERVRQALEELIALGKELAPGLLFAYANYPSTEYLEPGNADFTAFNVYLENESAFQCYLRRLHHIAGDRPLVISEFGLDTHRNGLDLQAQTLSWGLQTAADLETAGMTIYAWSDRWWNAGAEVLDWSFGLIDRAGMAKPGLAAVSRRPVPPLRVEDGLVSVIVCTRNGAGRIASCLAALERIMDRNFQIIVVDDGSVDATARIVADHFPRVLLVRLKAAGLSAARNAGAEAALGEILAYTDDDCEVDQEWLCRIRPLLKRGLYQAVCGPNLPPAPEMWQEAIVCAAPGAPSHVMLDDEEAEHLPGCSLVVSKAAFLAIGGFDPQFQTAGDDVDFCWRLRDAGFRLGFVAGAFVWHRRRPSLAAYLRQQRGYGAAERLLMAKHPQHFSQVGETRWQGFVYGGGPIKVAAGSIIYHGSMGGAGYQSIVNRMLPLRDLDAKFVTPFSRVVLELITWIQPRLRAWVRNRKIILWQRKRPIRLPELPEDFYLPLRNGLTREAILMQLTEKGWNPANEHAAWDLEYGDSRILTATERGDSGQATLLLRVWGKAPDLHLE